jgi:hypothetical protein
MLEDVEFCKRQMDKAKQVTLWTSEFTEDKYVDRIYSAMRQAGVSRVEARRDLRDRVASGLHNLAQAWESGYAREEWRHREYISGIDVPQLEVEWSDSEEDYGIEDDLPNSTEVLKRTKRPSWKWQKKNAIMEEYDSEWNMELREADSSKREARRSGGQFNQNDGRFHRVHIDRNKLAQMHAKQNMGRRMCKYWKSGWCKHEYGCTFKHFTQSQYEDMWSDDDALVPLQVKSPSISEDSDPDMPALIGVETVKLLSVPREPTGRSPTPPSPSPLPRRQKKVSRRPQARKKRKADEKWQTYDQKVWADADDDARWDHERRQDPASSSGEAYNNSHG